VSEEFVVREWTEADRPFLWDVLYLSIHVRPGHESPPRSILDDPALAHYLVDFGRRPGDDALVAEAAGRRVGGIFCRRMPPDDPGWGYVAPDVPELGMAVVDGWRGRGVGRALLAALGDRHPVLSLSCDLDNRGARRLYESMGYVGVAEVGTAVTMLRGTLRS
jgi:GNAT superfamily N-acetyltransferase